MTQILQIFQPFLKGETIQRNEVVCPALSFNQTSKKFLSIHHPLNAGLPLFGKSSNPLDILNKTRFMSVLRSEKHYNFDFCIYESFHR